VLFIDDGFMLFFAVICLAIALCLLGFYTLFILFASLLYTFMTHKAALPTVEIKK